MRCVGIDTANAQHWPHVFASKDFGLHRSVVAGLHVNFVNVNKARTTCFLCEPQWYQLYGNTRWSIETTCRIHGCYVIYAIRYKKPVVFYFYTNGIYLIERIFSNFTIFLFSFYYSYIHIVTYVMRVMQHNWHINNVPLKLDNEIFIHVLRLRFAKFNAQNKLICFIYSKFGTHLDDVHGPHFSK